VRRLLVSALVVGAAAAGLSWNSPAAVRSVSIAWAGDIAMVGSSDGGAGFFSPSIRKQLRSDLVIGNLEGTLTVGGSSKCGAASTNCFAFRAPPSYARLLRQAGFARPARRARAGSGRGRARRGQEALAAGFRAERDARDTSGAAATARLAHGLDGTASGRPFGPVAAQGQSL
jgi:hypothetical protein